jgi:hypothetical protein
LRKKESLEHISVVFLDMFYLGPAVKSKKTKPSTFLSLELPSLYQIRPKRRNESSENAASDKAK